jgi:hypothetical protein
MDAGPRTLKTHTNPHGASVSMRRIIVDTHLRLNETRVGISLNRELKQLMKGRKETGRRLRELAQELNEQRADNKEKTQKTADQLREMKFHFTRRVS